MPSVKYQPTDSEIEEARARGLADDRENAHTARYDAERHELVIVLKSGATVAIPLALIPPIANMRGDILESVEVSPQGTALRWDDGDIDISVPGLVRSVTTSAEGRRRGGSAKA
jgi:hypothetical protein